MAIGRDAPTFDEFASCQAQDVRLEPDVLRSCVADFHFERPNAGCFLSVQDRQQTFHAYLQALHSRLTSSQRVLPNSQRKA
jgi:hypothetical protein